MKKFVDVIVPLPIANQYTYSLPQEMEEMVPSGCRVVVPFGKKKFYTAIVTNVHYAAPEGYETKDIAEVLDSSPVLLPKQSTLVTEPELALKPADGWVKVST